MRSDRHETAIVRLEVEREGDPPTIELITHESSLSRDTVANQ